MLREFISEYLSSHWIRPYSKQLSWSCYVLPYLSMCLGPKWEKSIIPFSPLFSTIGCLQFYSDSLAVLPLCYLCMSLLPWWPMRPSYLPWTTILLQLVSWCPLMHSLAHFLSIPHFKPYKDLSCVDIQIRRQHPESHCDVIPWPCMRVLFYYHNKSKVYNMETLICRHTTIQMQHLKQYSRKHILPELYRYQSFSDIFSL